MAGAINRYPLWKYIFILVIIIAAFIYAAPNLYPPYPAVQIKGVSKPVDSAVLTHINQALQTAHLSYRNAQWEAQTLLLRFDSNNEQLKAKEIIQATLGESYLVALNLASDTPAWLRFIGAIPMKLGLDLRGGVHFLYQVDVDAVVQQRIDVDLRSMSQSLRDE